MMVYLNPLLRNVSSIAGLKHYYFEEAYAKGYFVLDARGDVFISYAGAAMIDLTNPEARAFMQRLIVENVLALGVSGWMAGAYVSATFSIQYILKFHYFLRHCVHNSRRLWRIAAGRCAPL